MASKTSTPSLKGEIYLHLEILKAENVDDPSGKGNVDPFCSIVAYVDDEIFGCFSFIIIIIIIIRFIFIQS